jgi:hypothetical protein
LAVLATPGPHGGGGSKILVVAVLLLLELAGLPLLALWQAACLATLGGDPLQDIVLEPEADLILHDNFAVGEALSLAKR